MSKSVQFKRNPAALRQMSEMSHGRIRDLAEDAAMRAKDQAQRGSYDPKAPHDTGNNADTIKMRQEKRGHFVIITESGYGGWLHIGTQKMPGRPYIRDGYRLAVEAAEKR